MTGIDTEYRVLRGKRINLARRLAPDIGRPMDIPSNFFPLPSRFSFFHSPSLSSCTTKISSNERRNRRRVPRNRPTELGTSSVVRDISNFRPRKRERERERAKEREKKIEKYQRRVLSKEKTDRSTFTFRVC